MYRAENREMDSLPAFRFVTGSLQVSYLKPTPLGPELEIRGALSVKTDKRTTRPTDLNLNTRRSDHQLHQPQLRHDDW